MTQRTASSPRRARCWRQGVRKLARLLLPLAGLQRTGLTVTRHEVFLPGLPAASDGLRVVQLTDLHRGELVPAAVIRAAVDCVNRLAPDLVVLTGDYVTDSAGYIDSCTAELARLTPPHGLYAVLGNHDHLTDPGLITRALTEAGIHVLTNRALEAGSALWVAGIDDSWKGQPDIAGALHPVPGDRCPVILTHNPALCRREFGRQGLVLSGHTHGGQIYVPGLTRRLMPGVRNTGYLRGWYQTRVGPLYVNRGVGTMDVPLRLFSPPEIAQFTLRAADSGQPIQVRAPELRRPRLHAAERRGT